jgi:hypothetical protein
MGLLPMRDRETGETVYISRACDRGNAYSEFFWTIVDRPKKRVRVMPSLAIGYHLETAESRSILRNWSILRNATFDPWDTAISLFEAR